MIINRIKLFSYYGCSDLGRRRNNSPAADTKTDYIIEVLNRLGYGVDIISCAPSAEAYFIPSYVKKQRGNTYRFFASFSRTSCLFRILNRWLMPFQLFLWCLINLKRDEQIIVYHSLGYLSTFINIKKIKKVKIIGEIEEIYQDVIEQRLSVCRREYKFINVCDKYIFPTQILEQKINLKNKPSLIIHGIYALESNFHEKFSDGKIHVVYGGTLDPEKGSEDAVKAALFLSEDFHIHICGFGDSNRIVSLIEDIQKKTTAKISFEGELKGSDYKHFIQKCHVGLCTQKPDARFNATSFPSKILVYLSNGLRVVSIKIPAIETSAIADNLFFYENQTPYDIAQAIIQANMSDNNSYDLIKRLDKKFCDDLRYLLCKT